MKNDNDSLSRFWFILSNAIPPIGFFLYFKHRNQFPNKAKKALTSAVIGVPIALVLSCVFNNYIIK
ncbi:hypothetical protein ACM39_16565 [Chryseobacterium sp. FH2]|uniref:hypothetical protein n=1 Tax=Chryseobacterium sp. FH2 TaxID=1674291 RepID=UPI00065AC802|nr:hypothetical protein [Chryseobacterium sp. FH2]KMQ65294.1 hypothetical protein ACM39_16565 [Chryseobacterium sp. FH2]